MRSVSAAIIRSKGNVKSLRNWFLFSVFLATLLSNLSCGSKPTDMRAFAPADSMIYLETNDLAAALAPIVDNESFAHLSRPKPDISGLKGVQLVVAVVGFEMTEERVTGEHSVGRVQPKFVAIADTHAWNWQAVAFAENQLGAFVMDAYRSDVTQEKGEKHGGTWFTWTANDERKAFGLVVDSLVYFGNDEPAIEKALSVKRGETGSISRTGKVDPFDPSTIASGYISPDGVAQLASLASLSIAAGTDSEPEVQSAITGILPQLIRGTVTEVKWTSSRPKAPVEKGRIEDRYTITSPDQIARVFAETLAPSGTSDRTLFENIPNDILVVTYYDLAQPNIAWRGLLLTSQTMLDASAGALIAEFSNSFAEPYGISNPELYLSGVTPAIATGNVDPAADKPFVISTIAIPQNVRASLDPELQPDKPLSDEFGMEVLKTPDGDLMAAFFDNKVISGSTEAVLACLRARSSGSTLGKSPAVVNFLMTGAVASTLQVEREIGPAIAAAIYGTDAGDVKVDSAYNIQTRFSRTGIERRTISDFGLIGWIVANVGGDR